MLLRWLERVFTFKPDAKEYADLSPFSFEIIERGDSKESTIIYAKITKARPVVVFAHGNTGNVSRCTWFFEQFEKLKLSYVAFDYPGYDKAKGAPSEESFYRSGEAVMSYLTHECGIQEHEMLMYGVSLGGGIAVELATRYKFCGLILESVFTNLRSMATRILPWFPVKLLPNRFNNRDKIQHASMPLFLLHGTKDVTTPHAMGVEVFDRHPGPKEILLVEGAGHLEPGRAAGEMYIKRLQSFIQNLYVHRKP